MTRWIVLLFPMTWIGATLLLSEVRWFARDELPELQHESVGALLALERTSIEHVRADDGT